MKIVLITACCLLLSSQVTLAEQSTSNLAIDSPKDALSILRRFELAEQVSQ